MKLDISIFWFYNTLNRLKEQKQSEELKTYLLQAQKTILSRDNELSLLQKNYNILLKQQQLASDMAVDKDNKWMTK